MDYNSQWNSPENKKRRLDEEWKQICREWNRWSDTFSEVLFKPLGWAIGVPAAMVLVMWLFFTWAKS